LLCGGDNRTRSHQHDIAVARNQLEDQPQLAADAEARLGTKRDHQDAVARAGSSFVSRETRGRSSVFRIEDGHAIVVAERDTLTHRLVGKRLEVSSRPRPLLAPGREAIVSLDATADVLAEIMSGNASEIQIAAFLIALRTKGETVAELAGLARTMRELAARVEVSRDDLLDTAGTGGGRRTFA